MIIAGVYAYKKYQGKKKAKELDAKNASVRHDKLIASVQYPINDGSVQAPPNAIPVQSSMNQAPMLGVQDAPYQSREGSREENRDHFNGNPFEQHAFQPASNRHSVFSERSPTDIGLAPPPPPPKDEKIRDPFRDPAPMSQIISQDPNSPTDTASQYSRPESSRYSYSIDSTNNAPSLSLSRSDSSPSSPPPYSPHELSSEPRDATHHRISSLSSAPDSLLDPSQLAEPVRGKWIWVAEDTPLASQAAHISPVKQFQLPTSPGSGARADWVQRPLYAENRDEYRHSYGPSSTQHISLPPDSEFVVQPLSIHKGRSGGEDVVIAELPAQPVDAVELPAEVPGIESREIEAEEEEEEFVEKEVSGAEKQAKEEEVEKWWLQLKQGRDSFA